MCQLVALGAEAEVNVQRLQHRPGVEGNELQPHRLAQHSDGPIYTNTNRHVGDMAFFCRVQRDVANGTDTMNSRFVHAQKFTKLARSQIRLTHVTNHLIARVIDREMEMMRFQSHHAYINS
jgi:hypothetical protein